MTKRQRLAKKTRRKIERVLILMAKRYSKKPKEVIPTIKKIMEALNATPS